VYVLETPLASSLASRLANYRIMFFRSYPLAFLNEAMHRVEIQSRDVSSPVEKWLAALPQARGDWSKRFPSPVFPRRTKEHRLKAKHKMCFRTFWNFVWSAGIKRACQPFSHFPVLSAFSAQLYYVPVLCCAQGFCSAMTVRQLVRRNNRELLADSGTKSESNVPQTESKRLFGIVPNYRTSPLPDPYVPISAKQKFIIGSQDAFDRGTVILAAAFAGEAQLTNANRSFGQGAAGYGRYFGTSYADYVIGDFMTESIYPTLLHQDPRYFRKGEGSGWSRFGYAAGQILFTHNDSGRSAFNYSEIIGNSTAVAISNAYYEDNRDVSNAVIKLGTQLGVDAAANILKEFWPDLRKKFSRTH
jgi:hypothetical protein